MNDLTPYNSGLSTAIIGIVADGVAAISLAAFMVYWFVIRKQKHQIGTDKD